MELFKNTATYKSYHNIILIDLNQKNCLPFSKGFNLVLWISAVSTTTMALENSSICVKIAFILSTSKFLVPFSGYGSQRSEWLNLWRLILFAQVWDSEARGQARPCLLLFHGQYFNYARQIATSFWSGTLFLTAIFWVITSENLYVWLHFPPSRVLQTHTVCKQLHFTAQNVPPLHSTPFHSIMTCEVASLRQSTHLSSRVSAADER